MSIRLASQGFSFLIIIFCLLFCSPAVAGPPFRTDDTDVTEYRHWEVYVATEFSRESDGSAATLPHFEINYGVLTDTQLHLLAPFQYVNPEGDQSRYGYGDTEIGVKYRLIRETESLPAVAVFPLIEIPTGDHDRGFGNGKAQLFLPLWLQKSRDSWTTYGGGGYWINPGDGNKDWWFFGWTVQRELSRKLTLGAEIFYQTTDVEDGDDSLGFNMGAIVNITEVHHLLFSAGRDISGPNRLSFYAGYQLTFGP